MPEIIVSDTSCFIILTNIGELDLLQKIYGKVTTTAEVADEFGEILPAWVEIDAPADYGQKKVLERQLGEGEASAIALALEKPESTIIPDDQKARKIAENLGLKITGTVGVIVKAKLIGIISSVKPFFAKIRSTNFRLSDEIERQALKEADEK